MRDEGLGRNEEVGGMRDEKGGKKRIGKSGVWEELRSRDERMEEGEGEKPEGRVRGKIVREGRGRREGEGQELAVSVTKCMEWAFILHRTHEVCIACTRRGDYSALRRCHKNKTR